MRGRAVIIVLLLIRTVGSSAQAPADEPAFEVASIKPRTDGPSEQAPESPDRFNRSNSTLRDLMRDAYGLTNDRIIGGPDWITSTRYAVAAKASFNPSPEQMQRLVRGLLADRFALKVHTERREMPVYLLMLAREDGRLGLRLTKTTADCAAIDAERLKNGEAPPRVPARAGDPPLCGAFVSTRASTSPAGISILLRYHSSGTTLSEFAAFLSTLANPVGRPVIDRTGLAGDFDIDLEFSPPGARLNGVVADDVGVSIFTAVREQLGLKLEPTRASVEVLVIDSVERPTPN